LITLLIKKKDLQKLLAILPAEIATADDELDIQQLIKLLSAYNSKYNVINLRKFLLYKII
jgi:hypothetical protein